MLPRAAQRAGALILKILEIKEAMTKKSIYSQYTNSIKWKQLKYKAMVRDNKACTVCGSISKLILHHLTYERLYNENLEDVSIVCSGCHASIDHATIPFIDRMRTDGVNPKEFREKTEFIPFSTKPKR